MIAPSQADGRLEGFLQCRSWEIGAFETYSQFSNLTIWFCLHCCHCRKDKWMACQDVLPVCWNVLLKTDTSGFWASYIIYIYAHCINESNQTEVDLFAFHNRNNLQKLKRKHWMIVGPFQHLQVSRKIKTKNGAAAYPQKRFNETPPPPAFSLLRALTSTWPSRKKGAGNKC